MEWFVSVGIDLGTSTTKMIVSRLRLARQSSAFGLPRFEIVERKLDYASPIYSTPLSNADEIDTEQVSRWLDEQYRAAGICLSDVKSGAVIITGETATKRNAQRIVHLLAEKAGDFVVATAGADLEALLAAKGAGAEERSRHVQGIVANIDVGGGTANTAMFQRGKLAGSVTFHVGGRLIRLNPDGELVAVSDTLRPWLRASGYMLEAGQRISLETLRKLSSELNRSMLRLLTGTGDAEEQALDRLLIVSSPSAADFLQSARQGAAIEEITVSGGIGKLMIGPAPTSMEAVARYGDFGPMLAHSLREELSRYPFRTEVPEQTERATVIGAGMQSVEISGATIHFGNTPLPLRNVPILKLELTERHLDDAVSLGAAVARSIESGRALYDGAADPPFALSLDGLKHVSYAGLQRLADALSESYRQQLADSRTLVVVCTNDMAKALGQTLELRCKGRPNVLCIDQVRVEHGDYIDVGEPISGAMVPVVVKTLAFIRN